MICLCYCCITVVLCHSASPNTFKGSLNLINLIVSLAIQDAGQGMVLKFNLRPEVNILVANTTTLHIHTNDLSAHLGPVCRVSKHRAIVAVLTIVPNGPMLYSGSLWIALQPLISLFTSWTAHSQTERQRQWLPWSALGQKACPPKALLKSLRELPVCEENARKGCLIIQTKMLWPRPSVRVLGNQSLLFSICDEKVIPVISHAVSRVGPRSQCPHCHGN